ncbi:MAG: hypothetical protein KDA28_17685, partial [Phycisphaerales bacterium]|nr:hypothetical protein [Phycisphaerales bacterium]
LLDAGQLTGLERIRRYRHTPPWPVFRFGRYVEHDSATPETSSTPRVLHQWCRGTMPDVHRVESNHEISFELGDGALGRLGECSLYCGAIHRADVPRYATANDETGSLFTAVNMPVETVLFDLFVHHDLEEALGAEASIYGSLWSESGTLRDAARLPVNERVVHLGRGANVATPIAEGYASLVQRMFDDAQWSPGDFHCLRFVVQYPPMPSTAMLRFPLATRPTA